MQTVQLNLPKDIEDRLLAELKAGRHPTLGAAIIEKLSRPDDPDLLARLATSVSDLREALEKAWTDRDGAVDGEAVFARLAEKSKAMKAQGR